MARRRRPERAPIASMPNRLRKIDVDLDEPVEIRHARLAWLETHGWSFLDFITWQWNARAKRDGIVRSPARRSGELPPEVRDLLTRLEEESDDPA